MRRCWAYNRFGVLMGASWRASCSRWLSLRGNPWPMITPFFSQGRFCATAAEQYEVAVVEPILRAFAAHTAPLEVVTTGLGIFTRGLQPVLYVTVARHPGL